MLRVYALTDRAPLVRSPRGLEGERLRLEVIGSVGVILGDVRRRLPPSPDRLRGYDGIIRRLAQRRRAVLPARYGTILADAAELVLTVRAREAAWRRALSLVTRRVQMTVRVVPSDRERRRTRRPTAAAGSARRLTGTAYLRARASLGGDVPGVDRVREAVRRWVRDERVEQRAGIASVYHLVPRSSVEAYRRSVERVARSDAGLRLVVTGPWPPYAFAGL